MARHLIIRILLIFLGVFIIVTILFFAMHYSIFNRYYDIPFSDFINVSTRLYKVFIEQVVFQGDWGVTYDGELVSEVLFPRFMKTLEYNLIAIPIYLILGVGIGTISAYYKDSLFDKMFGGITLVIGSLPIYVLMITFLILFAYKFPIFPHKEIWAGAGRSAFGELSRFGIPMMVMCAYPTARISNLIRAELIESISSDHYALCLAKGLKKRQIYLRHMLKGTLLPLLTIMNEVFIYVLTGSFFVEMAYQIEGVAEILFHALLQTDPDFNIYYVRFDVDVALIVTAFYMFVILTFALIIDILQNYADPRIKIFRR